MSSQAVNPTALAISVAYERHDDQAYRVSTFQDWSAALSFARWVCDSPELDLVDLHTVAEAA